jgi:hypothetical protein
MDFTEVEDEHPNGTAPDDAEPSWENIFDAPDFTSLVKPAGSRKAKAYETRMNSILKAGVIGCINAGDFPDAAAILYHGPQFAAASGQFAATDPRAEKMINLLTAPSSPAVIFLMTGIPLISQLVRNHEEEFKEVPHTLRERRMRRKTVKSANETQPPRFTMKLGKLRIPIRFTMKFKVGSLFRVFQTPTRDPIGLTETVFSNPDLVEALQKQGIRPRNAGTTTG